MFPVRSALVALCYALFDPAAPEEELATSIAADYPRLEALTVATLDLPGKP